MKKIIVSFFCFFTIIISSQEIKDDSLITTFDDAFNYMDYTWDENDKSEFKKLPESQASWFRPSKDYNAKIGWIRFSTDSKLIDSFRKMGIGDRSYNSIVLTVFHRKLNCNKLKINQVLRRYKRGYRKSKLNYSKEQNKIFSKFKVGDTLKFKFLRTFIDDEQEKLYNQDKCIAKGILLEKRKSDFNLKIKLVEICDEKGINIIDFNKVGIDSPTYEVMKIGDIFWNFHNDWEPITK